MRLKRFLFSHLIFESFVFVHFGPRLRFHIFVMRTSTIFTIYLSAVVVGAVDPIVNLSYSKYEGTPLPGGVTQWLGIRYAVDILNCPFARYSTDSHSLQAPPLGPLRFAAPTHPNYNGTVQKANKVSRSHPRNFTDRIRDNFRAAWHPLLSQSSWSGASVWQAANG